MTADAHAQQTPTFRHALNLIIQSQAQENPAKPGEFIEPSNKEIADKINEMFGEGTITDEYIRKLRKGDIQSPSVKQASRIAKVFKLPLDVFNAEDEATLKKLVDEVQRFVDSRRQTPSEEPEPQTVRVLARTARRLSPDGQIRAAKFVQNLAQIEDMENGARATPAHD
ncbi:hypothetical protein ACIP93_33510 [Streptomyces sp. NPDC088745]|uniref:hypothetical protein n=1 Tax=Streptomyces sp. NPDC088745 TaxID=3365884 RepID=UPI003821623E